MGHHSVEPWRRDCWIANESYRLVYEELVILERTTNGQKSRYENESQTNTRKKFSCTDLDIHVTNVIKVERVISLHSSIVRNISEQYSLLLMCSSRKNPYCSHRRDWNFLGGGGFSKTKKFKNKCTKLKYS